MGWPATAGPALTLPKTRRTAHVGRWRQMGPTSPPVACPCFVGGVCQSIARGPGGSQPLGEEKAGPLKWSGRGGDMRDGAMFSHLASHHPHSLSWVLYRPCMVALPVSPVPPSSPRDPRDPPLESSLFGGNGGQAQPSRSPWQDDRGRSGAWFWRAPAQAVTLSQDLRSEPVVPLQGPGPWCHPGRPGCVSPWPRGRFRAARRSACGARVKRRL